MSFHINRLLLASAAAAVLFTFAGRVDAGFIGISDPSVLQTTQLGGDLLTTSKVAHILGCSPQAVVRWIQKGSLLADDTRLYLEALSTPGGWRVRRSALDSYLARLTADRTNKPAPAMTPARQSARLERLDAELASAGFSITT